MTMPQRILDLLTTVGPMTADEVTRMLPDLDAKQVMNSLSRMYREVGSLHISGYHKPKVPRARAVRIYAAGAGRDAARPKFTWAAFNRERRAKRREQKAAATCHSSVFAWAQAIGSAS